MATYDVTVQVMYHYEVEADSDEEAEKQGWLYENYAHHAEVDYITISEQEDDEDDSEGEEY